MKFRKTDIAGVFLVEAEPQADERGFFARLYDPEKFSAAGIDFRPVQINLSRNTESLTLRGLHYQDAPYAESKLVQVTRGAAYDVVVDLRRDSPSLGRWVAFDLDQDSASAVFIPEGCAHGFLTRRPNTDVIYYMGSTYMPGHAKGYCWNDPQLKINWPAIPAVISDSDRNWPRFTA